MTIAMKMTDGGASRIDVEPGDGGGLDLTFARQGWGETTVKLPDDLAFQLIDMMLDVLGGQRGRDGETR